MKFKLKKDCDENLFFYLEEEDGEIFLHANTYNDSNILLKITKEGTLQLADSVGISGIKVSKNATIAIEKETF